MHSTVTRTVCITDYSNIYIYIYIYLFTNGETHQRKYFMRLTWSYVNWYARELATPEFRIFIKLYMFVNKHLCVCVCVCETFLNGDE